MRNRRGRNADPEPPRRGQEYAIEPHNDGGFRWRCFLCLSGNGSSPWLPDVEAAAHIHYRNAHTGDPHDRPHPAPRPPRPAPVQPRTQEGGMTAPQPWSVRTADRHPARWWAATTALAFACVLLAAEPAAARTIVRVGAYMVGGLAVGAVVFGVVALAVALVAEWWEQR